MKVDEKVAFYLRHQTQIDEWAACRMRLAAEAQRFYAALAAPLEALLPSLPGEPKIWSYSQSWSRLMLYRGRWREAGADAPDFAIGIEWSLRTTTFENAIIGVERQCDSVRVKGQSGELVALLKSNALANGCAQGSIWPIYYYAKPPFPAYWEHLEAYQVHLVERIGNAWAEYHRTVDSLYDAP